MVKSKFILLGMTTITLTSFNLAYADQSSAQYAKSATSSAQYGVASVSSAQYGNSNAHYGTPTPPSNSTAHYGDDERRDKPFVSITSGVGRIEFSDGGPRFEPRHRRHNRRPMLAWIDNYADAPLPPTAVVGGTENYQPLFVCHANYNGGIHPGKVVSDRCNISWGGKEIRLPDYQVLTSEVPLNWIPANNGYFPPNAIAGGFENGHELIVCQGRYNGGIHPGKIVGRNCNFGWGGREVSVPFYKVLVA